MKTLAYKFSPLVLAIGLAASCAFEPPSAVAQQSPNIILLMGDDHGWDETGYNNHPHLKTPVLDEMAAQGLRLDRFYAAHPSCSPTRGSVLTGRHPNRYGTFAPNWSIRPQEITVANILGRAGYACGHFGKWHLGPVKAKSPTNPGAMGFDVWLSHDNFFELNPHFSRNGGPPKRFPGESSNVLVSESMDFIAKAKKDKRPFLAVLWFGSPHEPYSGLAKDLALYDALPQKYQKQQVRLTSNKTGRPTTRPLNQVLRERYAEITAMDREIGRLRKWLEDQKLRSNTLIWYCGDNGSPSGASVTTPLRGRKGTMYEGGIRVPGIIEWPQRISKPMSSSVNTVTSDILPTLCELVGQPLPKRPLDGLSITGIIDGKWQQRPELIYFWSYNTRRVARDNSRPYIDLKLQTGTTPLVKMMDGRFTRNFRNFHHTKISPPDFDGPRVVLGNQYKLVIGAGAGTEASRELFDLEAEANESTNLADAKAGFVANYERRLHDWQDSVLKSLTGSDY